MAEEATLRQHVYTRGEFDDEIVMAILRSEFFALHGGPTGTNGGAR